MRTVRTARHLLSPGLLCLVAGLLAGALSGCGRGPGRAPSARPAPPPSSASTVRQACSTTLLPLAERWSSEYSRLNPGRRVTVSGEGSTAGLEDLVAGAAEIADASRPIRPAEARAAAARGLKPVATLVAYDGLAVIVNQANPLTRIPLPRLSDLYCGKVSRWEALGAPGLGAVRVLRREAGSGSGEVFRDLAVRLRGTYPQRDYAASAAVLGSSQAVAAAVAQDRTAIGYVGLGYVGPGVKALALSVAGSGAAVAPDETTVRSKRYPLSRPLYCYASATAGAEVKAYLQFITGPAGQAIVSELGFVPVSAPGPPK